MNWAYVMHYCVIPLLHHYGFSGNKMGSHLLATKAEVHISYLANREKTSLQTLMRINTKFIRITVIASLKCESAFTESTVKWKPWIKVLCGVFKNVPKVRVAAFFSLGQFFFFLHIYVVTPRKGPTQNGYLKNAAINPNITLLSACSTAYAYQVL